MRSNKTFAYDAVAMSRCHHVTQKIWASNHQADGHLTARSREVSKPRDSGL